MDKNDLIITVKRPRGDDGYKIFSIRVQTDLLNQIDNISAKTGRSRNELITIFLEYAIKNCKIVD